MSEDERHALGIVKRCHSVGTKGEKTLRLIDNQLSKILGIEFQEKYLSVNKVKVFLFTFFFVYDILLSHSSLF